MNRWQKTQTPEQAAQEKYRRADFYRWYRRYYQEVPEPNKHLEDAYAIGEPFVLIDFAKTLRDRTRKPILSEVLAMYDLRELIQIRPTKLQPRPITAR